MHQRDAVLTLSESAQLPGAWAETFITTGQQTSAVSWRRQTQQRREEQAGANKRNAAVRP